MTFEEYIKAVIAYWQIGGVTWEAAYWRVLQDKRPEVASIVSKAGTIPTAPYVNLGDFLYLVHATWKAKP